MFPDPITKKPHSRLADAFVDDTMLGKSDSGDLSYEDLIGRLQLIAQTWEHLLSYSGGALNLSKCFYYSIIYWEWPDGLPVPSPLDIPRGSHYRHDEWDVHLSRLLLAS